MEVSEFRKPDCLVAGGHGVNLAFEAKFAEALGADGAEFITALKQADNMTWLKFTNDFEVQKKQHGHEDVDTQVVQGIAMIKRLYKQETGHELAPVLNDSNSGLELLNDHNMLIIRSQLMDELFNDTVNSITEYIVNSLGDAEVVYLVGGFAKSKYLQKKIKNSVEAKVAQQKNRKVLVLTPKDPETSVVVGAILYSRSRENLFVHEVDASYGVVTEEYATSDDRVMHPHILEEGKRVLPGRVYEVIVNRNELQDPDVVPIYRNDDLDFITVRLREHREDGNVRVQLQIVQNATETACLLQVAIIDEISRASYIERREVEEPQDPIAPPMRDDDAEPPPAAPIDPVVPPIVQPANGGGRGTVWCVIAALIAVLAVIIALLAANKSGT